MKRRLITIKELSQYTGMAADTLYEWVHLRKIPFIKIGRLVKFDLMNIDKMIEDMRMDPKVLERVKEEQKISKKSLFGMEILTKGESSDWYERCVEAPIRPMVRLFRDNGFNTLGSCGHNMWIQFLYTPEWDNIYEISEFMLKQGYKDFLLVLEHRMYEGRSITYIMLYLKEKSLMQVYNPSAPGIIEMIGAPVEKK